MRLDAVLLVYAMKNKLHVIRGGKRAAGLRRTRQLLEFREGLLEDLRRHRRFLWTCRAAAQVYLNGSHFGGNSGADRKPWLEILDEADRGIALLDGWIERRPGGDLSFAPGLIEHVERAGLDELEILRQDFPEAA
jgi:hypothetical protein